LLSPFSGAKEKEQLTNDELDTCALTS